MCNNIYLWNLATIYDWLFVWTTACARNGHFDHEAPGRQTMVHGRNLLCTETHASPGKCSIGPECPYGIQHAKFVIPRFHQSVDDDLHLLSPVCCMYPAMATQQAPLARFFAPITSPRSHTSTLDLPGAEQSLAEHVPKISDPGWRSGSRVLGCGFISANLCWCSVCG